MAAARGVARLLEGGVSDSDNSCLNKVWLLPVGAEPLGTQGEELVYVVKESIGSVSPFGEFASLTWHWDDDSEPDA